MHLILKYISGKLPILLSYFEICFSKYALLSCSQQQMSGNHILFYDNNYAKHTYFLQR